MISAVVNPLIAREIVISGVYNLLRNFKICSDCKIYVVVKEYFFDSSLCAFRPRESVGRARSHSVMISGKHVGFQCVRSSGISRIVFTAYPSVCAVVNRNDFIFAVLNFAGCGNGKRRSVYFKSNRVCTGYTAGKSVARRRLNRDYYNVITRVGFCITGKVI